MAITVESSSPAASLDKGSATLTGSPSSFSPTSDKRFWSTLRSRTDALLENREPLDQTKGGAMEGAKRLKEDYSTLLLRGFDSVAHSMSQLSNNLENALQSARDLANPPTLSQILQCTLEGAKNEEQKASKSNEDEETMEENKERVRGQKRKLDAEECSEEDQGEEDSLKENTKCSKELGKISKAKNLAMSMATKAGAFARELKSIKSDMCFMQERCNLLEEENKRLRDGIAKGIRPEEDDLVRLQLEALLAEKSRLANENANLTRENRCLHQLVEYHQLTTQDLSASYENLIRGMCLDFSSPLDLPEGDEDDNGDGGEDAETPKPNILGLSKSLDECYDEP